MVNTIYCKPVGITDVLFYNSREENIMMMKIYVRERMKVREGDKQPMFRIVAVTGGTIQIELTHFRKFEIEQLAKDVGAEVIYFEEIPDDEKEKQKH